MSVLGIGGPELILLVVLVILILGPERAPQAAKAIGRYWRTITSAEWWQGLLEMWHFVRNLPQNLAEFAEVKEIQATLSDELSQVQDLTKGIQSDIDSVSKPIEAVLSGNAVRDTMQEMSNELTQSLPKIGDPESTTEATDPAPSATPPPSAPTAAPEPAITPPPPVPSLGLGQDVDEQMMALAEQISEQIEQLPVALARLDELESQQSQLDSRLERLQQSLDSILEQPQDSKEDEAQTEPPILAD